MDTLDELYAQLMANLPPAIWGHRIRTLTNVGASVGYPAEGDPLTIYRDTSVLISLIQLGNLSGNSQLWFTVKDNVEQTDDKSLIQIDKTGLLYISGQPAGSESVNGSIIVQDENVGNVDIVLTQQESAKLTLYTAYPAQWDFKMLKDGIVTILATGTMYIQGTPTRSIL
jgi:hypothetical protein